MNKYLFIVLILLTSQSVTAEVALKFTELKARLDKEVPSILKKHNAPGVALAFVKGDKLLGFLPYGYANVKRKTLIDESTMFNVGSISKVAAAWGVMQLVQQGSVELHKPIEHYVKGWKIPKSEFSSEKVTLSNILSHTSGLSLSGYNGLGPEDKIPTIIDSLNGNNSGDGPVRLIHEPDTKWSYSGGGYSVVQLLIEEVSGMPFSQYMSQNVFVPLGMKDSTFNITDEVMRRSATPYDEKGNETPMVYFAESAAAGLQTTAVDLARFTMAILRNKTGKYNGEQILAASFIDNMIVPAPNTDGNWSMSYIIDEENQNLGFAGFNRGWIAATRSMIDKNIGYVILANSSMSSPMRELDNLVKKLLKYQGVVDIE